MKKKQLLVLLSLVMTLGGVTPAFAQTEEAKATVETALEIQPRFKNIISINYAFMGASSGEAIYDIYVDTESATKIVVYMELQQKVSGSWEKIKGTTKTAYSDTAYFEVSKAVDSNGTYRVYYKTTVYYGSGSSEVVTQYKY